MSKKGNPALVGFFVIGAIIALTAVVIILGNISFGDEECDCVLYFPGSLHGLNEGAPVTFRGVRIGRVTDIAITFNPRASNYQIPVYIDIDSEHLGRSPSYLDSAESVEKKFLRDMIDKGLRAKLEMQSLVTGQLYIDFGFYPGTKPRYRGAKGDYLEIPTLPSQMEQLTTALANLDLESLITKSVDALDNLNNFLTSEDTGQLVNNFSETMEHLDDLILNTDNRLPVFVNDFGRLAKDFDRITKELEITLEQGRKGLAPITAELRETLSAMDKAAAEFASASENIGQMTGKDSPIYYELNNSLHEVAQAAESVKALADLLQRNPDILLYGPRETEER